MKVRVRELFVGDLIDHLESFQIAAIELARELRAKRNQTGLVDTDGLAKSVQGLFQLIRNKDSYIGTTRATRILRHRAKPVWGLDRMVSKRCLTLLMGSFWQPGSGGTLLHEDQVKG
jgi:hypothetical protein